MQGIEINCLTQLIFEGRKHDTFKSCIGNSELAQSSNPIIDQ